MQPSDETQVRQPSRTHRGPPLGRHAAAVGLTAGLMLAFSWYGYGPDWFSGMSSYYVAADASMALLGLVLLLGAGARLIPPLRRFAPWRRELGIAVVVTAVLHVLLVFGLDILSVSGLSIESIVGRFGVPGSVPFRVEGIYEGSNWLGLIALGYALVLGATSNDWSQRKLGRGWKFLQIQTYTLFLLVALHTAAFVVLGSGHVPLLPESWFWRIILAVVVAQFAGFVYTVRGARPASSPTHPERRGMHSSATPTRAMRWTGVVALWTALVVGTQLLGLVPSSEERAVDRLCQRYDELYGLPYTGGAGLDPEIRDNLSEEIEALIAASAGGPRPGDQQPGGTLASPGLELEDCLDFEPGA